jgi:hypothetical protein
VNGAVYTTFTAACGDLGLLQDDNEWSQCLQEASIMQTGHQLWALLVMILRDCQPTYPERLWDEFKAHICDDLEYRIRQVREWGIQNPSDEEVWDYGLYLIEGDLLRTTGNTLSHYKSMPSSVRQWIQVRGNCLIAEQRDYDQNEQSQLADEAIPMLNEEQREAFDKITTAVLERTPKLYFLIGPAGTGKTFVHKTLCYSL